MTAGPPSPALPRAPNGPTEPARYRDTNQAEKTPPARAREARNEDGLWIERTFDITRLRKRSAVGRYPDPTPAEISTETRHVVGGRGIPDREEA